MDKIKVIGSRKCSDNEFLEVRIESDKEMNIITVFNDNDVEWFFSNEGRRKELMNDYRFSEELIDEYSNYKNRTIVFILDISQSSIKELTEEMTLDGLSSAFNYIIYDILTLGDCREITTMATINDDKSIDLLIKPEDLHILYFNAGIKLGANLVGSYINKVAYEKARKIINGLLSLKND